MIDSRQNNPQNGIVAAADQVSGSQERHTSLHPDLTSESLAASSQLSDELRRAVLGHKFSRPIDQHGDQSQVKAPTLNTIRLRGETFQQEMRKAFSFLNGDLAGNLYALHGDRQILLQFFYRQRKLYAK